MKFSIPVTFTKAARRVDKSVGLGFQTVYEIKPEELMELDRLIQHEGVLTFENQASDSPDLVITEGKPAGLSPSQRIRFLMEQLGLDYEEWARGFIEKLETKRAEKEGN